MELLSTQGWGDKDQAEAACAHGLAVLCLRLFLELISESSRTFARHISDHQCICSSMLYFMMLYDAMCHKITAHQSCQNVYNQKISLSDISMSVEGLS